MKSFVINWKHAFGYLMVAVSFLSLVFIASCSGNTAVSSSSSTENRINKATQLLVYETYTNSEIGDAFFKLFKTAREAGDSVVLQVYSMGYEDSPVMYHTEGDTAYINDIIKKYGSEFIPDDVTLVWQIKKEYDLGFDSDSKNEIDTVKIYYLLALKGEPRMGINSVVSTQVEKGDFMNDVISIKFHEQDARQLSEIMEQNLGYNVAFVYKGRLISCPKIESSQLEDGVFHIIGDYTEQEAKQITDELNGMK